jgi:glycosyltransferase involved in cell wall biosynthesis
MRILFLADSDSPHTLRWIKSLHKFGHSIALFSIHCINSDYYRNYSDILLYSSEISRKIQNKSETSFSKLKYLTAIFKIKNIIKTYKPDIVHAHYASSYGLLSVLTKFKPVILSYWGSDVFIFPNRSFVHKFILKYISSKANVILSTSNIMKVEIQKYCDKEILVIPFGVDITLFKPIRNPKNDKSIVVIGLIKTFEENYGVKYLINAFAQLKKEPLGKNLKLLLVGKGSLLNNLKIMTRNYGIEQYVEFTGYVDPSFIYKYHQQLDIAVIPSISESFGVSAIESMACGKPVVASNVGGLAEVIDDGKTGILVKSKDAQSIYEALKKLVANEELRIKLGEAGRKKVLKYYNWDDSVKLMNDLYMSFLENYV